MSLIIRSAERPQDDFATWSLEELESEHFSIMLTSEFAIPLRAEQIQREINKRRSKKIEMLSPGWNSSENVQRGGMGGGFRRGDLQVVSAVTSHYKFHRKTIEQLIESNSQIIDDMLAYDKALMAETEALLAARPIGHASRDEIRRFVDVQLETNCSSIKAQYYTYGTSKRDAIPKKAEYGSSIVDLIDGPLDFTKLPDWSSFKAQLSALNPSSFENDWLADFSVKSRDEQRKRIFDDSVGWMYPTAIQPIDGLIRLTSDVQPTKGDD